MELVKRIGILAVGFGCSTIILWLLVFNCIFQTDTQVLASFAMGFPYELVDCPLLLHQITGYEGAFLEDGSDREVVDTAALVIENLSQSMLKNTRVAVYAGEECFMFFADRLPPGEKTVLLEQNAKRYQKQCFSSCWASCEIMSEQFAQQPPIQIQSLGMDTLELSNLSETTLRDVRIYHKTWSEEIQAYLGGISYVTYVKALKPGQILLVQPEHYALGRSKIIHIEYAGLSVE